MTLPQIFSAPMAGFSDAAFREVAAQYGAQMTVTEMISAKGLLYKNLKTNDLLKTGENENRIVVQLFGDDPVVIADAAQLISDILKNKLYGIDINMGCPAPKIVKNGEGCALMLNLEKSSKIIGAVRKAYNGNLSAKFRKGFDKNNINAVEFAKVAQDAGCDFITVHGRTREQYYGGAADWQIIKVVNESVKIPVVANGDVFNAKDFAEICEITGCSSVMIGRGALGNPFLFEEIVYWKNNRSYNAPSIAERAEICLKHARRELKYKNEKTAMLMMRTLAPKYMKGFKNSSKLREKLVHINTYKDLESVIKSYIG